MSNKNILYGLFVAAVLAYLSYLFVDKSAALFFNGIKSTTDAIFEPITHLGDSKYYIIFFLLSFFFFRFRGNSILAARSIFIWLSISLSGVVVDIAKFVAGRARPKLLIEQNIYGFEFFKTGHIWTSFPSGHSSTALSLGVALAFLFPKYRFAILVIAIVVALSRAIIAAHFISDVIVGGVVGIVTAVLLERYFAAHKCFNIYQNGCTLSEDKEKGKS